MATRKQMRQRRYTRRQRGGGDDDDKGFFGSIKNFFSKLFPIKTEPLLTTAEERELSTLAASGSAASGSVAINIKPNTPKQLTVGVSPGQSPPPTAITVGTPQGTPGSLPPSVTVSSGPSGSQTGIQMAPKIYGGKRKKNKRSKTQRKRK